MHAQFWHERWTNNQIGFHEDAVNPLLVAHFAALGTPHGARILLPLCGKTLDIDWLLARGCHVAGAELSALAVAQLFARLELAPRVERAGSLERWSAAGLEVFVGDFLAIPAGAVGVVDAVYDRAALIALPSPMRHPYALHLRALSNDAPQLLITLDYDQEQLAGPPFSVSGGEVRELYPDHEPVLLARHDVPGGLKGRCAATEEVWLLR